MNIDHKGHTDSSNTEDAAQENFAPISAAEALCELIEAAQNLGMQTSPTKDDPYRVIAEVDIKEVPKRMYRLVKAIERMNQADVSELDQILEGAATQLSLKISLYTILGWIAAQGLPTREVSQMVMHAVAGPIRPNGSLAKLQESRHNLTVKMGAAAPAMRPS